MNEIESDTYRTKDGKAFFSFSFFKENEFYDINVTFAPPELNLKDKTEFCVPSKKEGFSIISEQKARDIFTAKLIAGAWAEKIWKESI